MYTQVANLVGPSLAVFETHWEMVGLGIIGLANGLKIVPVKFFLIWSVPEQESEQRKTTVESLLGWPMTRQDGYFLLWPSVERQFTDNQSTLVQQFCATWVNILEMSWMYNPII